MASFREHQLSFLLIFFILSLCNSVLFVVVVFLRNLVIVGIEVDSGGCVPDNW